MKSKNINEVTLASSASRIVAGILTLPYLFIGFKEVISPAGVDATFGIPLINQEGLKYLSVVGARNIVLSLLGIYFAVTGVRSSMVALFVALALMAAMDCYLVTSSMGFTAASIKHASFVLLLTGMAIWVANSNRSKKVNL